MKKSTSKDVAAVIESIKFNGRYRRKYQTEYRGGNGPLVTSVEWIERRRRKQLVDTIATQKVDRKLDEKFVVANELMKHRKCKFIKQRR